jgi:LmbE family N-acetylglucosaminyl deacetylase
MATLATLLENTLVVVAHPDDETIGCGCLMQRMNEVRIVFATDGAPTSPQFWPKYQNREHYASARKLEACDALAYVDADEIIFLTDNDGNTFPDQELFRHLDEAAHLLQMTIERTSPKALLTSAYEGGHPDHDCCNFLVNQLATRRGIPVWELPLYHRDLGGQKNQDFWDTDGSEVLLQPTYAEIKKKQQMTAAYSSQADALKQFTSPLERFRPLAAERYDYFHPPHPGQLNYEAWGWPMSGADVCASFADYLHLRSIADRWSA